MLNSKLVFVTNILFYMKCTILVDYLKVDDLFLWYTHIVRHKVLLKDNVTTAKYYANLWSRKSTENHFQIPLILR